jgi:phage terminase large subunit
MFIKDTKLFIDYEFYAVGIEITELERAFDTVPESRTWTIRADSERPDTISYMRQRGFNIVGAEKGKGSVEDGIQFLRSFEQIVIHPRCRGAIDNFLNYRWKQDRITQEVLPIPADGSDHVPDSARYALEPYIKAKEPMISWI